MSPESQSTHDLLHSRDELLSLAAHEIRTPLTALKMQLELLHLEFEKQWTGFEGRTDTLQRLSSAIRQARTIEHLTNEMFDFSTIQFGKLRLHPTFTDLSEILQEFSIQYRDAIQRSGTTLELSCCTGATGIWDHEKLKQVIINLVFNAVKYGRGKPVYVRVESNVKEVSLKVTDSGDGISPEDQERIFEKFVQLNSRSTDRGLGLGLYVSKKIVEAHDGEIEVTSALGTGTTFTVRLPRSERPI